jgi:hypothetical protein|uniref:hypothetical protein n=1 Tax=Flavobacterium sp. TaxID=239 RepID=UPI004047E403
MEKIKENHSNLIAHIKMLNREQVIGLGRVLQTCISESVNDVQGFDWSQTPTFHSTEGKGFWINSRVITTYRADPRRSECE